MLRFAQFSVVFVCAAWACGSSVDDTNTDPGNGNAGTGSTRGSAGTPSGPNDGGNGSGGTSSNTAGTGSVGSGGVSSGGGSAGAGGTGPAPEPYGGIGKACETSSECADGLHCNFDYEYYTSHGQCTADCDSSEECEAEFGEDTMCIGAHLCTAECDRDEDCPALARCGEYGWCERMGPGSGSPYCSGSPTPCSLLSTYECTGQAGCRVDGDCSGTPSSCYYQSSSYSCNSVDGCYWSTYSNSCSGTSTGCYSYASSYSCVGQTGCYWNDDCTGVPSTYTCTDIHPALCDNTPGCTLID